MSETPRGARAGSPEDKKRAFELLEALLDVPAAERSAALDAACRRDAALRRRLETLLRLETRAEGYLEGSVLDPPAELREGERLGPYRIIGPLGRGGMGAVYRAVREEDFEKEVAVKIIRAGLPRELVENRFHGERQILADLDHPGIARLLDGGATVSGSPYLVMELVDGVPLLDHCRSQGSTLRSRLRLFLKVLDAVAYAHRRLVAHRDLKPDNVLVTPDGRVKLLDFGIAELLDRSGREASADRPMTLLYAAPEQVRGEPMTTAGDIYSLGVVLFRLLTGKSPYEPPSDDPRDLALAVCGVEPRRASERVPPGLLRLRLRGDLDAVLQKALEKDPRGRYASAEAFAEDLRRYLDGRPLEARRGDALYRSLAYRFGKTSRRRPLATLAVLLMVASSLSSVVLWHRADQERAAAVRDQERAQRVADFLAELFRAADPDAVKGRDLDADALLDQARARLAADDDPELAATLARLYESLGRREAAAELTERSRELRRTHSDPDESPVRPRSR